jgi:ABC-2 type transport system permease protein
MTSYAFSWFLAVTFYTVFWCCLIFYWVSWQQNSAFNALVLLGNWLFFVVLIPTFLNLYLQSTKPISSGANLQRELREITEKGWSVPKKENLAKYFAEKGKIDTTKISADMVNEIGLIYYMDKAAEPHFDEYKDQLANQIDASNAWSWLSPAMQTQTVLNQIADSDTDNYLRFLENAEKYYYQIRDFFDRQKLANKKFEKNDFEKIPKAEISSNHGYIDSWGFVNIIAFGLAFLLLGLVKINKK